MFILTYVGTYMKLYIITEREHRFDDGVIIPKNEKLSVVEEKTGLLTVEYSGHTKIFRKKYVKVYSTGAAT